MGAFLKKASSFGIPATELVFMRAVFQGFFVILGMLRCREDIPSDDGQEKQLDIQESKLQETQDSKDQRSGDIDVLGQLLIQVPFGRPGHGRNIVVLRGIVGGGFGFICYFYSIKSLPLGDAITLFSIYPVYTIFMAKFFLDENITCSHVVVTILNLIGGALIAGPSFLSYKNGDNATHDDQYNPLGYITALVGGVFAASVVILIRKAGTLGVYTLQLLFSWCCFGLISSVAFGFTFGLLVEGMWVLPSDRKAWSYIFATCAVGTLAHAFLNYAGRFAPAGLCALVRSTDILWAYVLEVVVFEEIPRFSTIAGAVLILVSLTTIAIEKIGDEMGTKSYNLLSKEAKEITRDLEELEIELT